MKDSFRQFDQKKEIDLVGIGNAIVDIISNVEEEFIETNNLTKGTMSLISSDQSKSLLNKFKLENQISGGSSANTVVCLSELGNNVQFMGRVKNDQFGNFFTIDIQSNTIFTTPPIEQGPLQLILLLQSHPMLKEPCVHF